MSIVMMHFALIAGNVSCFLAVAGSLQHTAAKDFEVGEYVIPKGATVVGLMREVMYNTKVGIIKHPLILSVLKMYLLFLCLQCTRHL